MIKYAVFDWDGTIAETYAVILKAYRYVFKSLNLREPTDKEIKEAIGKLQNKDIFSYFFDASKIAEAKSLYYDYIEKYHLDNLKLVNGAVELLDFCVQNNIKPLLMTNKRSRYLDAELKKLGLEKYFVKVVAAGELAQDKPHQIACQALFEGKMPNKDEVIVIGDGKADVEVAKNIMDANKRLADKNLKNLEDKEIFCACQKYVEVTPG